MTMMITNDISNVEDKYMLQEIIGTGSFATVRKCQHKETGELFAVKSINKRLVKDLDYLKREIKILQMVDHPNIIQLHDVFEEESGDVIHLVTDLCTGGELFTKAKNQSPGGGGGRRRRRREGLLVEEQQCYSEKDVARWCKDILDAVRYLHNNSIVHRDLKPENFLLLNERENSPVKIVDFGLACFDESLLGVMRTPVGSPSYVAPEVLEKSYTNKCDLWSIGASAYLLLSGSLPFDGATREETLRRVKHADFNFSSPQWDTISDQAKDFCMSLMSKCIIQRPTATQALKHPWIVQVGERTSSPAENVPPLPTKAIRRHSSSGFQTLLDKTPFRSFDSSVIRYNLNVRSAEKSSRRVEGGVNPAA